MVTSRCPILAAMRDFAGSWSLLVPACAAAMAAPGRAETLNPPVARRRNPAPPGAYFHLL